MCVCLSVCTCVSISAAVGDVSTHQSADPPRWRDHRHLLALWSTQESPHVRLRDIIRHRRRVVVALRFCPRATFQLEIQTGCRPVDRGNWGRFPRSPRRLRGPAIARKYVATCSTAKLIIWTRLTLVVSYCATIFQQIWLFLGWMDAFSILSESLILSRIHATASYPYT